ncbi:MAG: FAD-dependent oxidoreductase [Herbiconiux sp.]|nr:FAD-dependent oxidoreductase [Herbiconiux sp.]
MSSSNAPPSSSSSWESATPASVLVVGAGIAGLACARALREAGVAVRVAERGRRPGGRMSGRTLHGRPVDLGAAYFTVPEGSAFGSVSADWESRGLARPWTDTLTVLDAGECATGRTSGPMRYAAPGGLRSLVADLAEGLDVSFEREVVAVGADGTVTGTDGRTLAFDTVALAMPDPQAVRLLEPASAAAAALDPSVWEPTVSVALGFAERFWPDDLHAAFVNGSPVIDLVADDGDRRGDGAPVLVAHSTAAVAREHLDAPEGAIESVLAEVLRLLGAEEGTRPVWTHAHRWSFARPGRAHPEPYLLQEHLAVCGDAWGPRSSVSTAWASGDALGRAIAARG